MSSFCMTGYSQYERTELELIECPSNDKFTPSCRLLVDCVSQLTPFDIVNLYNGIEDATGNKIWMGALLFVEAFAKIRPGPKDKTIGCDNNTLMDWRRKLFQNTKIVELGCGTGVSGLSILRVAQYARSNREEIVNAKEIIHGETLEQGPCPSSITFTDSDANVLDLCRRNYAMNFCSKNARDSKGQITTEILESLDMTDMDCEINFMKLDWGETKDGVAKGYDTVIATDVLYDLPALRPLLETASSLLKEGGFFVLSHVPRASVDGALVGKAHILEEKICITAALLSFELQPFWRLSQDENTLEGKESILRPLDFAAAFENDCPEYLRDMQEAGAGILVFRKVMKLE